MSRIAEQAMPVTGGVDTHADVHVAAVVDWVGRVLGTEAFPATAAGYRAALAWMSAHGERARAGVEGTGSYGAGLARYLAGYGIEVAGVIRPDRQARRRRGKSGAAGAVAAALAALSGEASGMPTSRDGAAGAGPGAAGARAGAVKARTQAGNQLRDLITTAPERLRAQLSHLSTPRRVRAAAAFTCGDAADPAEGAKAAMASVARRWQDLDTEITRLEAVLEQLVARAAAPEYLALTEVGSLSVAALIAAAGDNPGRIRTEAAFAALCGVSTVDCSSGKQERHRLNHGGDRQANSALWRIVFTRMACDPRTQAYVARRTAEGKTRKEIMRCLKRYVAREIYKALVTQARNPAPGIPPTPAA